MNIDIKPVPADKLKIKPESESNLGFGRLYCDHMFTVRWTASDGWTDARVAAFQSLQLSPAALVLHYGQTIFEGLKAYRNPNGSVNLFRPEMNWARFNRSASRVQLPTIDKEYFIGGIEALLALDHEWIPRSSGTSLYIRPTMIATEPYIGLKSSSDVLMFIITGPVGAYYPEGFDPIKIKVCQDYSRAGPRGLGAAKTAANYAASLLAEKEAANSGFTQVLWLDACEQKYIEEVGSMNIFFKINGKCVTPSLGGTTLAGVTRDSVIQLLRAWDIPVEERRISIDEVVAAQNSGTLEEVFGTGTAAVISPVGMLDYQGKTFPVGDGKTGTVVTRLYDELTGIQYGSKADPFSWIHTVTI